MSAFEMQLFDMNAARNSAKANSAGSGSVMETMEGFYHTVELESLSKRAISEINKLSTLEDEDYILWYLVFNIGQLGFFVNHNIAAICNALYSPQPVVEALKNTKIGQMELYDLENATEDKDKEAIVTQFTEKMWDLYNTIIQNCFVLKSEADDFQLKFVPGSNPNKFLTFERAFDRRPGQFSSIERFATFNPSAANLAELNDLAKHTLDRLSTAFKVDLTKITDRVLIELPLDFEFSILFKQANLDTSPLNIFKTHVDADRVSKYKDRWKIVVSIRNKATEPLTSPLAQLAALEFITLPTVRISKEAAQYLTQSKTKADVKLSTLNSWAMYWVRDIFECTTEDIDTVNSLLDNFHFSEKKEKIGIKSLNTRADPDTGLYVNFEGRYAYAPSTKDVDESTIKAYEAVYDKFVEECAKHDEPISLDVDFDSTYLAEKPVLISLLDVKDKLVAFHSSPLISNWDMNICASINVNDPTELSEVPLAGGTKPTVVSLGEILTDNLAGGMKAMLSGIEEDVDDINFSEQGSVRRLSIKGKLAAIYSFLKINGKILDIDDYLEKATQAIHGQVIDDTFFEYGVYQMFDPMLGSFITKDCTKTGDNAASTPDDKIRMENILSGTAAYGVTIKDLKGNELDFIKECNRFKLFYDTWALLFSVSNSSYLRQWELKNYTGESDGFSVDDSKYWLDTVNIGKVSDLARLARYYIVGRAFSQICNEMLTAIREPKNIIFAYSDTIKKPVLGGKPVLPSFTEICEGVMPFLSAFGYIINHSKSIVNAAETEKAKFKAHDDTELLPVPDGKDEFAVFKHQSKALQLLRNEPRVAFLDISPGGGKTVIGLTDCLTLMSQGKVKRPLIIAPQSLIKNWMADLNTVVTEFKYNCIPLIAKTVDKWGEKKLTQMILNSPPNTLFFTDMSFVSIPSRKIALKFMNMEKYIYTNLEWMKQFEFDYILIDECHYLKNAKGAAGGSARSRLIAELTLNPEVKYIRLASGTIISNDVDDIIGQTRLVDPSIFRTQADFVNMYSDDSGNAGEWSPDAAERIRQRLSKYCGVARAKRKDWAYALPLPKEEHPNRWVVEMDKEFKTVYEHVCRQTILEMENDEDLMKKLKKKKKGETEDDALERILAEEEEGDDEEDNDLSGKLQVYIDRLEQFVNAPESDPLNGWNGLDFSKLNTPKMDKLVELLDSHFQDDKSGKVIIFVRHIDSVYGIINRLPPKYRSMAIDYHGSIKSNLNQFRYDDECKIVVGVEMSMNTGENLQIASRIIRMELCWAPGEVEQAIARVFRPDFNNKYNRLYVHSDWIIADDSLEIPKLGRLISKMLRKVQFDEYAGNPQYRQLPYVKPLGMDIKKFLNPAKAIRRAEQVQEYFDAYYALSTIQYNEFIAEREKYIDIDGSLIKNPYVPIENCAPLEGAQVLSFTPIVPDQNFINDSDDDGLEPFKEWLSEHKEYLENPAKLIDKTILVYTEFGYGYINAAPRKTKTGINQVQVMLSYGEKINVPADALYIASTKKFSLRDEKSKKYIGVNNNKVSSKYKGIDPREAEGLIYRDDEGSYHEYKRSAVNVKKPLKKLGTKVIPKPVEENVDDDSYVPENTGEDNKLYASLCLIDDSIFISFNAKDPDASGLKGLQFTKVNPFVGIEVQNLMEYDKVLANISKSFNIVDNPGPGKPKKFEELRKRFHAKTKLFNGQYSNDDIKFLILDHKRVKNDSNIKLNYLVEEGKLYLVFSIEANPEAAKLLVNKKPSGVADKFKKYGSLFTKELHDKKKALVTLAKVNKVVEIVNYNEIVDMINNLTKV